MWEKRCFGSFSEVSYAEEAAEMLRQILSCLLSYFLFALLLQVLHWNELVPQQLGLQCVYICVSVSLSSFVLYKLGLVHSRCNHLP